MNFISCADEFSQKGKQEAQKEIAIKLLKSNVDREVIAQATNLPLDKLEKLAIKQAKSIG